MKKLISLIGILCILGSYNVWAGEVQVFGSVDKRQIQVDEEVSLTIRILGAAGNVSAPRLPVFQGFESFYTGRSSQFTFVNGKSSATVEFNYVLIPKVAGRYTLSPVEVWIEGKRYQTEPLDLEVIGPQVQPNPGGMVPSTQPRVPAQMQPPGGQAPDTKPVFINDDKVFMKATVNKQVVYPNEQILLTYSLYTQYDTRYEGFEEEPAVTGFWIEDFPLDRDLGRETVSTNGKRYVKADVRKIALFPTSAAEYTIQPGVIKVSVREQPNSNMFDEFFDDSFFSGASFFSRRVERLLKPNPLTIKVKPFPEAGKPASFNGAVGQFRMSASVDKQEVKQNEPVTLKLVVEGEGNVETLPKPHIPELSGFKIYEGDSSSELFKTGVNIGGKKNIELIFIPTESGDMAIPPLEFSFFNPRQETYQILRTQAFPLKVAPSNEPLRLPSEIAQKEAFKKEVSLETKDIRYIHEDLSGARGAGILWLFFQGLLLANFGGMSFVIYSLFRRRRETLLSQNMALKRKTMAKAVANQKIKKLRRLEADQFLTEAEKILTEYLSNKFNLSAYQFTTRWLEQTLAEAWPGEEVLLKEIRDFYELVGQTRYGRGAIPTEERNKILELIEKVIRQIEKIR